MKKIIAILFIISFTNIFGQWGSSAIKLGVYSPSAADGGFIIGYEGGKLIENGISIGWSLDWFHKSYVDKNLVENFNEVYGIEGGTLNELRAKTNLHSFPIMGHLTYTFPAGYRFSAFVTGGIGAEVLLINYRNFQNPDKDEFHTAFDLNWEVGVGGLYEIGSRTEIFGELTYHSSKPGWEYEVYDPVTNTNRTFERAFDMSGLMARIGFRFFY